MKGFILGKNIKVKNSYLKWSVIKPLFYKWREDLIKSSQIFYVMRSSFLHGQLLKFSFRCCLVWMPYILFHRHMHVDIVCVILR